MQQNSKKQTEQTNKSYITQFNAKDLIIILAFWYISSALNGAAGEITFQYAPWLTGYFRLLFISAGRFLFIALSIYYLITLYQQSFTQLGINIKSLWLHLKTAVVLIFILFLFILVFINLPLSYHDLSDVFNPLYEINDFQLLISSFGTLAFLIVPAFIISFSEQFMLNNIIYKLFRLKLPHLLSLFLSSLFYSVLMLEFQPQHILINLILAIISIYLFIKSSESLLLPVLFATAFYSFYICYIFGWEFIL